MTVVTNTPEPTESPRGGTRWLWAAVVGTPVLWSIHLVLNYVLVLPLCRSKQMWVMHAITVAFAALAAVAVAVATREWGRLAKRKSSAADAEELSRAQFLAVLGVMVSTFFFMVILATGIPAIFIDPCAE